MSVSRMLKCCVYPGSASYEAQEPWLCVMALDLLLGSPGLAVYMEGSCPTQRICDGYITGNICNSDIYVGPFYTDNPLQWFRGHCNGVSL